MFYQLRKDSYVRKIDDYGYIKSSGINNDLVFDASGREFLLALSRTPQSIGDLSRKIASSFVDTTADDIQEDVAEFFDILVEDGYVVRGETFDECSKNNIGFSYSDIKQISFEEDYTPKNIRASEDTQVVFDNYFKNHPYLSTFQFELTSRCNERCLHCYIPHEYKNDDIEPALYYSVLDQLQKMGTLGVTLSGGEPMAHPQFKEFLKAAKDKDFYVHILSNLTLLDDEIIEIMCEGNTTAVQVSLYSMIPKHHDSITTVKGSFYKTRDAILKLISRDIPVQINCPVIKENKNDAIDVIKWGHEHKVRVNVDYAIMAEYNHQTDNLVHRLTADESKVVIADILNADEEYQERMLEGDFEENLKTINTDPNEAFCGVGINTACMVASGSVYPCPGWQGYDCGNLYEKSLEDIWYNSDEVNRLREYKKGDIPKCLNCDDKAFCSPCLARFANESQTGNPLEIAEHFCKIARLNKEMALEWRKEHMNR